MECNAQMMHAIHVYVKKYIYFAITTEQKLIETNYPNSYSTNGISKKRIVKKKQ